VINYNNIIFLSFMVTKREFQVILTLTF